MERIREELRILKNKEQLRSIPAVSSKIGNSIIINNEKYINFASNDYLGIGADSKLQKEFLNITESLLSSASARLLSGTSSEYNELENTLCNLFKKEACLVFNTGYQCNLGVISTLCSKGDVVFSDKLNHASIIDGMKLAEGDFVRYKHLDYEHLETLLKNKRNNYNRAIVVSESVFSMDGDIADIEKLVELKTKYNCLLMIDEAHAFCAVGKGLTGLSNNFDIDIITATFGKALGSFGAFCVSNKDIIDYLINKARSFIFSTSIPPLNIAWSNWLLNYKTDEIAKRKAILNQKILSAHKILADNDIVTTSKTHIIPLISGTNENTAKIAEKLKSLGYYIPAIRPPTVPEGTSRLRISLTADANIDDFEAIIKAFLTAH